MPLAHRRRERRCAIGQSTLPLPPWKGPAILLVDLDAFFASVEQLDHPAWRGKPVIVGGDPDKRGVVSTASYEARPYGVRSAMPSSTARRLCPHAIWTRGRFDRYREVSNEIMDILRSETPHVQQVSIDEAFLDVSPTAVNREHPVEVARRIQRRVEELGVTCSIGVGTSKTVAKIASDMDKPRGLTVVYPGGERDFLGPLPVRAMSGIGASAEEKLHSRGIRTLGELADADLRMLERVFGKNGRVMHVRANGGDDAPVEQDDAVKSVSNEMTFATDLTRREDVEAAIATMAAKVGRRLRRKGLRGRTLALRVKFDDRSVRSVQRQLPRPSDDELAYTPLLYAMVDEVWRPGMPAAPHRRGHERLFGGGRRAGEPLRRGRGGAVRGRRRARRARRAQAPRPHRGHRPREGPLRRGRRALRPRAAQRGEHHRLVQQEPGGLQVTAGRRLPGGPLKIKASACRPGRTGPWCRGRSGRR